MIISFMLVAVPIEGKRAHVENTAIIDLARDRGAFFIGRSFDAACRNPAVSLEQWQEDMGSVFRLEELEIISMEAGSGEKKRVSIRWVQDGYSYQTEKTIE